MTVSGELCRDVAFEAVRRGARVSPHELWAALEAVDDLRPRTVVDVGSGAAVWWAWWALGVQVVGVAPTPVEPGPAFGRPRLPEGVVEIVGDRRDRGTVQRVSDQLAGHGADAVVLSAAAAEEECRADFHTYGPLTRPGGLVLVQGIADPGRPGVAQFWSGLAPDHTRELVGTEQPIGFGVVEIHGKEQSSHG
jgi:hypothetical protein